jgi:hypothetical protein
MNIPQGPWYIDDTLTFTVTTHRFDTGALTDADAVPAYRVYEDETGTAILTGNMAKLDDAGTTGFYSEQLTLSAANGFEVGKSYNVYVSAAVNSVTGGQSGGFKVIATPVAQTGDSFARLGAPVGASISADVAAVQSDTNDIQTRIPAALTAGGNIKADALAWAGAATATNDVALATAPTNFAALSVDVSGQVSLGSGTLIGIWNVDTSLITPDSNIGSYVLGLATAANLATVDTVADAIKAKTDQLTFGVANVLNANITHVNEVEVTGDGETGTEWGPV